MNQTTNMTVRECVEWYLREYAYPTCKPSAAEHYSDNLRKHLIPALGDVPLAALNASMLQSFFNEQAKTGNLVTGGPLSAKSMRNLRAAISACCKQAVICGLISENPVSATVIRKTPRPTVQVLEDKDRDALIHFLLEDSNLMNFPLILAAELGLRRGEVCALRWKDYDPGGYLMIRSTVKRLKCTEEKENRTELVFGEAKTEQSKRALAVSPWLQRMLLRQVERFRILFHEPTPDDFICFNSFGTVTDPDNLSHYFSDVLAGLQLPHVKLHALRHTFASRAVELGIDIQTVSGLLGHTDVATTAHYYLHPRQESMNRAMSRLSLFPDEPQPVFPGIRPAQAPHTFTRRATFPAAG